MLLFVQFFRQNLLDEFFILLDEFFILLQFRTRLALLVGFGGLLIFQSPREFYVAYFLGQILGWTYTICLHGQILISSIILSGWMLLPSHIFSCIHFVPVCHIDFYDKLFHHCHYKTSSSSILSHSFSRFLFLFHFLSLSVSLSLLHSLSLYLSLSLSVHLYRPSLRAGPLDCIQYPHRADVCQFLLVGQHWPVYTKEFTWERRWLIRFYFSKSTQHVLFVLLWWFWRWEVSDRTAAVLWSTASDYS